jgi:hypothetical protein
LTITAWVELSQHTDAAMNITETMDPNVKRVRTFSRGLTNLLGYKVNREKGRAPAQPTLDIFCRKIKTPSTIGA